MESIHFARKNLSRLVAALLVLHSAAPAMACADEDMRCTAYPWRAIGKVVCDEASGTGSLIGPDLVLTARHVVLDENGEMRSRLRFLAGYIDGEPLMAAHVIHIWYGLGDSDDADWAIARLDRSLGTTLGTLGVKTFSTEDLGSMRGRFVLVGYRGDWNDGRTARIDLAVGFFGNTRNGALVHNGNASHGSSGAGIFGCFDGKCFIVAEHTESFEDGRKGAVPATSFLPTLKRLLAEDDAE